VSHQPTHQGRGDRRGVRSPLPPGPDSTDDGGPSRRPIARAIYPAGFYRTKARTIREICRTLLARHGGQVPATMEELLALKGVGRKTANLVLTIGFGMPGICVDTHVHRISNRLGIVDTNTPEQTESALRQVLPAGTGCPTTTLVTFGQNLCKPISPLCSACPVHGCSLGVGALAKPLSKNKAPPDNPNASPRRVEPEHRRPPGAPIHQGVSLADQFRDRYRGAQDRTVATAAARPISDPTRDRREVTSRVGPRRRPPRRRARDPRFPRRRPALVFPTSTLLAQPMVGRSPATQRGRRARTAADARRRDRRRASSRPCRSCPRLRPAPPPERQQAGGGNTARLRPAWPHLGQIAIRTTTTAA
jgi:hypothetical protein